MRLNTHVSRLRVGGAAILVALVAQRAPAQTTKPLPTVYVLSTGGTIAGAVKLLQEDGACDVLVAATHGVLSDPAPQRLAECGAREVIVTNTLPIGEDKQFPQLTVLSIAPLLASTIRAVFENGSVTGLFDGSA